MTCFKLRKLTVALTFSSLLVFSSHAMASAFQLWEQDATNIANFHAGYAAAAYNASTAFYNPAGINRFTNQQLVFAVDPVVTSFKYTGTAAINTIEDGAPQAVTAQGGSASFIPAMHYVTPLSEIVSFGLSVDVPFGLMTNYGKSTALRYVSTMSSVKVIDIGPVLSFKLSDNIAFGFGPDLQIMHGEFDQVGTNGVIEWDGDGINRADDTGYGMHAGMMYDLSDATRFGLSYHSQVVHHLTGTSSFSGPLVREALEIPSGEITSKRAKVNITLPPYTALSAYHKLNSDVALMGSVIYTQWSTLQNLVLQNVAGIQDLEASTNVIVTIPQHFRNTYSLSLGADYFATDKITLRGGLGYDQTPVSNIYRNVQMPDNNHYAVAVGGHYQTTSTIGFDIGWTHIFVKQANVNPPAQVTGDEIATTNGSVTGGADVFAAQLVWDLV
jgi:long-chain fatty acid transport protein